MSYILPNGNTLGVTSLKDLEYIAKCLRDGTPITVTVRERDGTETTQTIWHPDDPPFPFHELTKGYQPPKTVSFWRRLFRRA